MNTENALLHTDPTGQQPQLLDRNTTTFTANGTTYHVLWGTGLSLARERELEKLSIIAGAGARDLSSLRDLLSRAYSAVNTGKMGDAAVILDNTLRGMVDLDKKANPLYYVCTLFINREGENAKEYDPVDATRKINDWQEEGLDRDFFLGSALSWLKITGQAYATLIQDYSTLGIQALPDRDS